MRASSLFKILLGTLAAILLALTVGFFGFAASLPRVADGAPERLAAEAPPPERRAIVALTGGAGQRIEHALALHAAGLGDRVFISGVNPRIDPAALSARFGPEVFACCVELGEMAKSTKGNALETRAWLNSHGYTAVYLVTSNFHLPRAVAELRSLDPELDVIGVPVDSRSVPDGDWGTSPKAWAVVGGEYAKLLAMRARSVLR